jgi:hypothetical protein
METAAMFAEVKRLYPSRKSRCTMAVQGEVGRSAGHFKKRLTD